MDCGKRILWSWTQSIATKIRAATVQSSVWTLQQILPDETYTSPDLFIPIFYKTLHEHHNAVITDKGTQFCNINILCRITN